MAPATIAARELHPDQPERGAGYFRGWSINYASGLVNADAPALVTKVASARFLSAVPAGGSSASGYTVPANGVLYYIGFGDGAGVPE